MAERFWPCHFCGELIPVDQAEFYRLLPAGFMDCGECFKNWGILFKNSRQKATRRLLIRRKEPAEEPPPCFTPDEIPLEHSWLARSLSGVIAKASEWHKGNAIGDLLTGLTYAGLNIIQGIDWGKASWLPPISPPSADDVLVRGLEEPWRSIMNVDRALLALHGLFAGYSILALVRQARVGDGQTRVGNLFIDRSFDGDTDQFAGVILPHFHPAGQCFYWAFRDHPDEAREMQLALGTNVALVFQRPLISRAVTSTEDAAQEGLDLGEGIEGMLMLPSLFSDAFVAVNDLIVKRATGEAL